MSRTFRQCRSSLSRSTEMVAIMPHPDDSSTQLSDRRRQHRLRSKATTWRGPARHPVGRCRSSRRTRRPGHQGRWAPRRSGASPSVCRVVRVLRDSSLLVGRYSRASRANRTRGEQALGGSIKSGARRARSASACCGPLETVLDVATSPQPRQVRHHPRMGRSTRADLMPPDNIRALHEEPWSKRGR